MKPRVYVETSVISYLTNRPALDVITAGHQATTYQWWEQQRTNYDLVISQIVVKEAGAGDPVAAARRLATLDGIPLLDANRQLGRSADRSRRTSDEGVCRCATYCRVLCGCRRYSADVELQTHREWSHDEENSTCVHRERV